MRSRSITKPWLSYFHLEAENSIVSSLDTDDLTEPQTRSGLQSKNCRQSCSWAPTSKSRRSDSTAMKCAACTTAPNFRLRDVVRCSSGGTCTQRKTVVFSDPFRLKGVGRLETMRS